ncbi:MAG: ribonuclease R family protein, partial [Leptolyngbyaceae bacterium]|nr:ribonuclease R family protein [Leptolyngbyaceae bacterium]
MEFSIATLLASFPDDKLIAPKALEKKLGIREGDEAQKLQIALDALERINLLEKDRGRYRRVPEENLVEGKLRCSSKGFCFAIQDVEGADDIYVRESQLNTAWNGDRVLVSVTKEGSRRRSPEGEVRLILERANQSVLGRVKQVGEDDYRAVPLDDRLLFELELKRNGVNLQEAVEQLVHVEILRYPLGQHPPVGRVAQILGINAEAASDIAIVRCKHDLPLDFPEVASQEAKRLPSRLRKVDMKDRLDLRKLLTLRITGPQFSDEPALEDAISLESLEGGKRRLGVHIADVGHYVEVQGELDRQARRRGISIFLGNTIIPMFPELVHRRCSLIPGSDRLTISVLMTLDKDGQVLEFEIQPTLVAVDYEINYQQAQTILTRHQTQGDDELAADAPTLADLKQFEPIFETLDQLLEISQSIRQQRLQRGAFELNLPEKLFPNEGNSELGKFLSTKFEFDDEGAIGALVVSRLIPARSIVIELMLLANQLVASHLKALGVPAIYRVHRMPDVTTVQELLKLVANMNIEPSLEDEEEVHPRDYQRLTQQFAESEAEKVLTYLLLDTLKPAVYSTTPDSHFGLALDSGYTHFTSPLRRYPDLLIHRVLRAVFEEGRDRRSARSKERVNLRHSSCHGK